MSKQKFHLNEWQPNAALTLCDEIEIVTSRIELAGTDIAPTITTGVISASRLPKVWVRADVPSTIA